VIIISEFLKQVYFGNSMNDYLMFLISLLISFIVIQILKSLILKYLFKWISKRSEETDPTLLPTFKKYLPKLLYIVALNFCLKLLVINMNLSKVLQIIITASIVYYSVTIVTKLINFVLNKNKNKIESETNRTVAMNWLTKLINGLVWGIAVLFFLDNIGVDIGAIGAGLGIGGIAIAFASQAVIEDFFSYFTIFFDRPFIEGDFLVIGDFAGTVEHIGVRTTRIRSLSGEQLVFSNKDLTSSRIKNYKTMEQRRIVFSLGVTYDTPLEKLKIIPNVIKETIETQEETRFDRAHFASYGDSSLVYEVVYYVLSGEYTKYMDIHQAINFEIREKFDALGVEFAFPSRTLYIHETSSMKLTNEFNDKDTNHK